MSGARRREDEAQRFARMNRREEALWAAGYARVAGIDEAGRGPLAGPVCVAACILDPARPVLGLNDSKKIAAGKRERLAEELKEAALAYAVRLVAPRYIDAAGINRAIRLAAREALAALAPSADYCLYDYVSWTLPEEAERIVGGDARCNCIAAASILAKVARDRYMREQARLYPEYGFASNVGYGSAAHLEALRRCGPSPIHRLSFLRKILAQPAADARPGREGGSAGEGAGAEAPEGRGER